MRVIPQIDLDTLEPEYQLEHPPGSPHAKLRQFLRLNQKELNDLYEKMSKWVK